VVHIFIAILKKNEVSLFPPFAAFVKENAYNQSADYVKKIGRLCVCGSPVPVRQSRTHASLLFFHLSSFGPTCMVAFPLSFILFTAHVLSARRQVHVLSCGGPYLFLAFSHTWTHC
jgi:hypothetical protein